MIYRSKGEMKMMWDEFIIKWEGGFTSELCFKKKRGENSNEMIEREMDKNEGQNYENQMRWNDYVIS